MKKLKNQVQVFAIREIKEYIPTYFHWTLNVIEAVTLDSSAVIPTDDKLDNNIDVLTLYK